MRHSSRKVEAGSIAEALSSRPNAFEEIMTTPEFPLRIIFDDGEVDAIESAEDLMERVDAIDSTDTANRIWIRDAFDRTVLLRVRSGVVEVFEVV